MKLLMLLIITIFFISCDRKESSKKESDKNKIDKKTTNEQFKLIEKRKINNLNAIGYTYEHIKTGAKVIYIDDNSPEKNFGIAFKTPVVDNTGVNHVFEHSVLQGSKKYPDKNLFYELDTKNIPTFLNAMTGKDYTLFPFSAVEPHSFDNLLDVYLDAVFNPDVLNSKNILKREGWRYDRDKKNNDLIINGIVYNEMRGAYSNPYRNLFFRLNELVYSDSMANYRFESGGIPNNIPHLTLEQLQKTHKKYYTPSNSVVVLAGKLDIKKELSKLDEYYSKYNRTKKAKIVVQKTPLIDKLYSEKYPAPKGSPEVYIYSFLMKPKTSIPELSFITSLLADYEISPLKKLFNKEKFSGNFGFYNDGTIDPKDYFVIVGAKKDEIVKFRKLIDIKLKELAKTGIDPKVTDLALQDYKKQLDKSQYIKTRASYLITNVARSYFYYNKPYQFISDDKIKILEELANNPDKIKKLINEYFVNNSNRLELFFTPDDTLLEKQEKAEKSNLAKFQNKLSSKELKKLDEEIKSFNAWSKKPVAKKISDSIPRVKLKELSNGEITTVKRKEESVDGVIVINNDINTYNINLVSLKFDTSGFTQEEKLDSVLFSFLCSASGTKDFSYDEIDNNLTKYFYNFDLNNRTTVIDNNRCDRKFIIDFEYMQENNKIVYKMLKNIFLESKFDNKLEMKKRLEGFRDSIINSSTNADVINRVSIIKTLSMSNPNYRYYLDEGINFGDRSYYAYPPMIDKINNILKNYNHNFSKLQENMKKIRAKLFNKTDLLIFYANKGNYSKFKKDIIPLLESMKSAPIHKKSYSKLEPYRMAINVAAQNGSSSWGNNLTDMGYKYNGKYCVMRNMINEYLNDKIRIQNGAYGAWFNINLNNFIVASSYRDGEVDKTVSTYREIPAYLESKLDIKQEKLNGFILKSLGKYYQSYTPEELMNLSYGRYLYSIDPTYLKREKSDILSTTTKDIPTFIDIMDRFVKTEHYSTVNNKEIIKTKGSKTKFDKIIDFKELK